MNNNAEGKGNTQLFKKSCKFLLSAQNPKDLPTYNLPEVAFWGRSNVGKSSLLNALTNRLSLARVSKTPGRTRQLNFFNLDNQIILVDMPGYGFAKAPKIIMQAWQNLINYYIHSRTALERIYLLIDARRGLKDNDIEVMNILNEKGISYQIVLTKSDKINKIEQEEAHAKILHQIRFHAAAHPDVMITSSKNNRGAENLRENISYFAKK